MDYTPTTEEVRNHYSDKWDYYFDKPAEISEVRKREAAFDRWLAARDREVAARAWDEGATAVVDLLGIEMVTVKPGEQFEQRPANPYRDTPNGD